MLNDDTMMCQGIPADGMESVYEDRPASRTKLEDGDKIERLTGKGGDYAYYLATKEDTAMKYRWEKITDAPDEETMYLRYNNMQKNAI